MMKGETVKRRTITDFPSHGRIMGGKFERRVIFSKLEYWNKWLKLFFFFFQENLKGFVRKITKLKIWKRMEREKLSYLYRENTIFVRSHYIFHSNLTESSKQLNDIWHTTFNFNNLTFKTVQLSGEIKSGHHFFNLSRIPFGNFSNSRILLDRQIQFSIHHPWLAITYAPTPCNLLEDTRRFFQIASQLATFPRMSAR